MKPANHRAGGRLGKCSADSEVGPCPMDAIVETFWAGTEHEYTAWGRFCTVHRRAYDRECAEGPGATVLRMEKA